jgi:acetyl esterase
MAGAPLADARLTQFIADLNAQQVPPAAAVGAEALRAGTAERAGTRPRGPEMARVVDVEVPPHGVRCRLYVPDDARDALVVFLHGGGWVIGDLATHDRACRLLASESRVPLLAVDYRRAPEHPWPAAVDDAVDVVRWLGSDAGASLGSWSGLAIAGDSAGGTTAALACLRLRDETPDRVPDALVMVYANTDLTQSGDSMRTEGHGYGLEVGDVEWFTAQWVPDPERRGEPGVSPLFATLHGLPPTVVVTCEHDPLRDQGEAFADRSRAEGVPTTLRREAGMVHNFLLWDLVSPACAAATRRVAEDLARVLAPA